MYFKRVSTILNYLTHKAYSEFRSDGFICTNYTNSKVWLVVTAAPDFYEQNQLSVSLGKLMQHLHRGFIFLVPLIILCW